MPPDDDTINEMKFLAVLIVDIPLFLIIQVFKFEYFTE